MAARGFALSENLYYNDYVFDEQKGRMTDMKKAIIVLLTATVTAGITLTAAGLPASEAYAAVATPGNMVTEESGSGGEEEGTIKPEDPVDPKPVDPSPVDPKPVDPKPVDPDDYSDVKLTIDKNPISVGETTTARVSFGVNINPDEDLSYFEWKYSGLYTEVKEKYPDRKFSLECFVTGIVPGQRDDLLAVWTYSKDYLIGLPTKASIYIYTNDEAADGASSFGSGSSSVRSSSKSSEPASAKAPLPAVTPIVTDSNGISHFGDTIIAMIPAAYPEQYRTGLISSGTWTRTANGYWQLNTPDTGTLHNCWALVSDILSRNPTGSASWYYFDNYGYMVTGWQEIGGKVYYFNEEDGSLYGALLMDGVTPDRSKVDETGARKENGAAASTS